MDYNYYDLSDINHMMLFYSCIKLNSLIINDPDCICVSVILIWLRYYRFLWVIVYFSICILNVKFCIFIVCF